MWRFRCYRAYNTVPYYGMTMRILLIDDHALFREAIAHVLTDLDAVPIEAATANEAFQRLKHHQNLDLILLDLSMPGMGGLEALPKLSELAPTVPIVVVSASEDAEDVRKAIEGGAAGYIPKTSSGHEMKVALRVVLSGETYVPASLLFALDSSSSETAATDDTKQQAGGTSSLTPRQLEVLNLMGDGLSNKVIAGRLGLSEGTVKLHVYAVLRALNSRNRTEAVVEAQKKGLISHGD